MRSSREERFQRTPRSQREQRCSLYSSLCSYERSPRVEQRKGAAENRGQRNASNSVSSRGSLENKIAGEGFPCETLISQLRVLYHDQHDQPAV
jgi:ribonuclease PH